MSNYLHIAEDSLQSGKKLWQSVAIVMSMLMLFSLLLFAFHHHEGEQSHDDCNICSVLQNRLADVPLLSSLNYLPFVFLICLTSLVFIVDYTRYCQTPQNRAPPEF